ncbi:PssE/Cps14G family polysaccharide biosynthesis glycosyltransferase [Alteromonas facilis]|uniref:PssE/Cps14G family polysaccharide biosynthesis glycosyltransferase n=1 Tax=Alteromonas facilis TaxID=2048004 RepID=UPI000C287D29|nr:PssE/Cps14G family polysaccharide biosynthesis glycosyltransferase [Alteromonas facilis]
MKVFVTVGTTTFDSMIAHIDQLDIPDVSFTLQIGPSNYKPKKYPYFEFSNRIEQEYLDADCVISHCGAGSTYRLLELGKPLILVPNLERVDKHQSDLAQFVQNNNYAHVAWQVTSIGEKISLVKNVEKPLTPFSKTPFFYAEHLQSLVRNSLL